MKHIYIVDFKIGGKLTSWPFYAATLKEAHEKFHRHMANHGAEREQYRITGCRIVVEPAFTFRDHWWHFRRLSDADKRELFSDRRDRQLREAGRTDPHVKKYFQEQELAI